MQRKRDFLGELGERLDIPCEVLPGGFSVLLSGHGEVKVRGCRRILRYEKEEIALLLRRDTLVVRGSDLLCSAFGAGNVTITGKVAAICLEGEERNAR